MTEHLPECRLSEPCDIDIAEHGFCSMQVEEQFFCIHCMGECICQRLQQAMNMATFAARRLTDIDSYNEGRREGLADAMQIVEELPCKCNEGADYCDGQTDAIAAILMLAKGDQP
jgi:hypothetical protein